MKRITAIFLVFMFTVLTGCATFTIPTYNISGTVKDDNTSLPINNASVSIQKVGDMVSNSQYTNSQGQFNFSNVKEGTYNIEIIKDGYYELTETLVVNQELTGLHYALSKIPTYSVTVHTVDSKNGLPVEAEVTLRSPTKYIGSEIGTQVTFSNIQEGDYTITAEAAGYYPETVELTLNGNKNLEIRLEPIPKYDLTIISKDSLTQSGINATVNLYDSSGEQVGESNVGSTVSFEDLFAGNYTVEVSATDYFKTTQTIELNSNKTITISLDRKFYIDGKVVDANTQNPISTAKVTIGTWEAYTNDEGDFTLGVKSGNYTLRVSKDGYQTLEQLISVTNSTTISTIQLEPQPLAQVNVSVVSKLSGFQITGATISLTDLSNNQLIGTKLGGNVTFTITHFGNYRLDVSHTDCLDFSETRYINSTGFNWPAELEWTPASASGQISYGQVILNQKVTKPFTASVKAVQPLSKVSLLSTDSYNGILVEFYEDVTDEKARQILNQVTTNYTAHGYGLYRLQIPGDIDSVINTIRQFKGVKNVQPNHINHLMSVPEDTYYSNYQWNLPMINMPSAWDYSKGEYGNIIVAVLDTGVRASNNMDLYRNIISGYDVVNEDSNAYDDVTPDGYSHGTHMASIIGAVTDNGSGLAGTGWNLQVMPIKVCYSMENYEPITEDLFLAEGIRTAVDMGADVINISIGNSVLTDPVDHPTVESALEYAFLNGVAIIAASGNDGDSTISYPASSNYTLAVGAVDYNGSRAPYSNYGTGLSLVAPGGYDHDGDNQDATDGIVGYAENSTDIYSWRGTSSAAAQVSAVAGLIYTLGVDDPDTVYQILIDSATSKSDVNQYGAGILNASGAMFMAANDHETSLSDAKIYAAIKIDDYTWETLTTSTSASYFGYYTLEGIPANLSNVYIIAYIDNNDNGVIEIGEFFGYSTPYTYSPGQDRDWVDFNIFKVTAEYFSSTANNSVNSTKGVDQVIKVKFPGR